jgi:hypothetical protein
MHLEQRHFGPAVAFYSTSRGRAAEPTATRNEKLQRGPVVPPDFPKKEMQALFFYVIYNEY